MCFHLDTLLAFIPKFIERDTCRRFRGTLRSLVTGAPTGLSSDLVQGRVTQHVSKGRAQGTGRPCPRFPSSAVSRRLLGDPVPGFVWS